MAWDSRVNTKVGVPTLVGAVALLLGFGGFGTWAAIAPLDGAVIAPGTVMVSSKNKFVQHLEGGVVSKVLVNDGDRVTTGDILLILDATAAESARNRLRDQASTLAILAERVLAERAGLNELVFPPELLAEAKRQGTEQALFDQTSEYRARLDSHNAQIEVLEQKIAARNEEIVGIQAYLEGISLQLDLLVQERQDSEGLLGKGLISKSRVLQLKRTEAELKGNAGQLTARIGEARRSIAESTETIHQLKMARIEEASSKLIDVRLQQLDIAERLRAAQFTLDRVVVRAPASGTIINVAKFNAGAVVAPGQQLMEIVPDDSDLIVEAQVRPIDIDQVRPGQAARLAFTAFDQRTVPQVPGEVTQVSADRLADTRNGEPFYLIRLKISKAPLGGYDPSKIGPGQPVQVFITTGERTLLAYLTDPITHTFTHGMREN